MPVKYKRVKEEWYHLVFVRYTPPGKWPPGYPEYRKVEGKMVFPSRDGPLRGVRLFRYVEGGRVVLVHHETGFPLITGSSLRECLDGMRAKKSVFTKEDLIAARQKLGFTQPKLAEKLGVHWVTISRWERGVERIGNPVLVKIAIEKLLQEMEANHAMRNGITGKLRDLDEAVTRVCKRIEEGR